ncbi:uncharacterized protein LOC103517037, partial [Diaphorina citri]|uniref:Uncharacterized protein LOC103517037 n=1 Tax=Diaphorina citri TaxID=121845 RepID=A0A3Q0J9B2_DIACI
MTVGKVKGFKVTNSRRTKLVGIAAKSLKELLAKSCEKFDVRFYFQKKSISIHKIRIVIERLMRVGNYLNLGIAQHVSKFVQKFFDHNIKEKLRQLNRIVNAGEEEDDKTGVSSRDEDPDWFTGLETNARTKEAFMFKRSQERIRGYLYKSRSDIRKSPPYESDEHIRFIIESIFSEK